MKYIWKDIFTAVFAGMILPGVMLNCAVLYQDTHREGETPEPVAASTVPETVALPMLLQHPDGTVQKLDMDAYLLGVVLAEMPASFEMEALKAQAVAARTYTRKAYVTGGKHGNGAVCTDSGCCQAYLSKADYLAKGGLPEGAERIRRAVAETSGLVLTYEGELIEATYFSCSGGSTEDAASVWGTDFPYLQAVLSPGEEEAAHFTDTVNFTSDQFLKKLGKQLEGDTETWFGAIVRTEGGGVASIEIGGECYTGTQIRRLLNLRSTAFSIEPEELGVTITTYGYGHRVGMSQYGADAMAVTGSSFAQILAHYYPGTKLTSCAS